MASVLIPLLGRKAPFHKGSVRHYKFILNGSKKLHSVVRALAAEFLHLPAKGWKCCMSSCAMKDTVKQVTIPLKSNPILQKQYTLYEPAAIWALIFKDVSIVAESICYAYNTNSCIDTPRVPIHIFPKNFENHEIGHISCLYDLILTGMVTWAGQAVMETTFEICQDRGGNRERCLSARILMEARDPSSGIPIMVTKIVPGSKDEEKRFQQAQYRQDHIRKQRRMYPLVEKHGGIDSFPKEDEKITPNTLVIIPSRSEKKITSGLQVEKAVEMAFYTANIFTGHREKLKMVYVDYIDIHRPVNVHSSWRITSEVVYTRNQCFQVAVMIKELDTLNNDPMSNFLFTFKSSLLDLPVVNPRRMTMEMRHLDYRMMQE